MCLKIYIFILIMYFKTCAITFIYIEYISYIVYNTRCIFVVA